MLVQALFAFAASTSGAPQHADAMVVPARFEADRVYVVPTTKDGQTLHIYTDTGGGGEFLLQSAVKRLGLATQPVTEAALKEELGFEAEWTRLPALQPGQAIPAVTRDEGRLLVFPDPSGPLTNAANDGMLGAPWFAGRVWTWDYPGQQLTLEGANWQTPMDAQRVTLGFRTGADGQRQFHFPRIEIRVDGQVLPMLLDTGAMTVLTTQALQALNDDRPAERATSMVADSVFQAWRKAHPDWRVIEKAQAGTGSAMIEVPDVEIAGSRIGPVWFTHRPDAAFHDMMSSMMDARVEGAIGGNVFRHFVMTVDYPGAAAYFRCVRSCR